MMKISHPFSMANMGSFEKFMLGKITAEVVVMQLHNGLRRTEIHRRRNGNR